LNILPDTGIKSFNQEIDAAILCHPMIGVKHFIPLGMDLYVVISVPPRNILELQADFYTRKKAGKLAQDLLRIGWTLEFANMDVLQRHVIQVVESDDVQLVQILDAYVHKRITQLYATIPPRETLTYPPKEAWELDKLINLQTLLQQREKMRPALLNVYRRVDIASTET
jgi:hypothetical protein